MLVYLVFMAPALLIALWAQMRVKSTFAEFARVGSRSGLTGAEVARLLLRARGLPDVQIERSKGFLSDHYDPRTRTLRLSEATHDSRSVAAIGVAAHETGHALQHADGYTPLQFRSTVVPAVSLGSKALPFLVLLAVLGGAFHSGGLLAWLVVSILGMVVLFSLVTLPVEYNASARALALLENGGVLTVDEMGGARKVLDAAALTYVAAAIAAVLEMAYWAMLLFGGGRDD